MLFSAPVTLLQETINTQMAVLLCNQAHFFVECDYNHCTPALVMGHSLGGYSALIAAGAISFAEAIKVVSHRAGYRDFRECGHGQTLTRMLRDFSFQI